MPDVGIRQRLLFAKIRPTDLKLKTGAPRDEAGGKPKLIAASSTPRIAGRNVAESARLSLLFRGMHQGPYVGNPDGDGEHRARHASHRSIPRELRRAFVDHTDCQPTSRP